MQTNRLLLGMLVSLPIVASTVDSLGPFGGTAAVLQVVPHHPGTVLAATSNALIFKSTDSGASWVHIPFPAELRATLHAFVVSPRTDVYWAGAASDRREYAGVYRSADEGRTWRRLAAMEDRDVWSIAIFRRDADIVAAGTKDGVFLTRDGGTHWDRISPESNRALMPVSLAFDPVDSRILYAGTPHLPWKTLDGGATWQPASSGMEDDSDVFSIHVDPARPDHLFASACSGIYLSLDQASNWTKLAGAGGASYRTYHITQHPTQPNVLLAGTTDGLVKSTNGGKTWRRLSRYPTRSIAFDPVRSNRIFVATDDAGLFRSDDLGESLTPINKGFCNRSLVSVTARGSVLYAISAPIPAGNGIFRQTDSGTAWENVLLDLQLAPGQPVLKIVPLDEAHLFAMTTRSILTSASGGRTWSKCVPPARTKLTALLVQTPDGGRLSVGSEDGIYYSNDGGETWQEASSPVLDSPIRALVTTGTGAIAAITRSAVLLSTDGAAYRHVNPPAARSEIYALIATDRNTLLAATSRGLIRSEDLGATWRPVTGIPDGNTVSSICKHPSRPGVLFASAYGVVFASLDYGRSWTSLNIESDKMPDIKELVAVTSSPERLIALTHTQGVYSISLGSIHLCRSNECAADEIKQTR